jgi:hypothetical protein
VPEGIGVALSAKGELLMKLGPRPVTRLSLGSPPPALPPAPVAISSELIEVRQAGRTYPVLHVKATGGEQRLEAAVWLKRPRASLIWAGATGELGDFGAFSRELSVTPKGVALLQRTRALMRCDGLGASMLGQGFHFASGRLLPILGQPPVTEGAVELTATTQAPSGVRPEPLAPFRFESATSELGCDEDAGRVSPPSELHDGRPQTAWIEGRGGPGRWEYATAQGIGSARPVVAVRLLPGHAGSIDKLRAHNRLKVFWLIYGPNNRFRVTLPADPALSPTEPMAPWWVVLPKPVVSRCLTLMIEDVYPGPSGDTAVSELTVFTSLDFGSPLQSVLRAVTAQTLDREEAVRTLRGLGPSELPALRAAMSKAASAAEQEVILRVLAERDPIGSVEALAQGLKDAPPGLRRVLLDALGRAGERAVPALASLLAAQGVSPELARDIGSALSRIGTEAAALAILGRLGRGGRELRRLSVGALASFPPAVARPLLWTSLRKEGHPDPLRADLVRALKGLCLRHRDLGQEAASLALELSGRPLGFEARYRLLELMAELGDRRLAAPLTRLLQGKEDSILREMAALALGRNQDPGRQAAIGLALADPSPRVRRGAALAWAMDAQKGQLASGAALNAVLGLAEREPWSFVREAVIVALAEACPREAHPVLLRLGARAAAPPGGTPGAKQGSVRASKADMRVRRLGLLAALRCSSPGLGTLLGRILRDQDDRTAMRALAVRLIAELRDRSQVPYLAEFLELLSREVKRPKTRNEAFAADIALALGRLGDRRALPALLVAAGVVRLPQLQAAAIEALGSFCDPQSKALVQKGQRSADRMVVGSANRSAQRCGW